MKREATVATAGLLLLLLDWCVERRAAWNKAKAKGLLLGFLRHFEPHMPPGIQDLWTDIPDAVADKCHEDEVEGGFCCHLEEIAGFELAANASACIVPVLVAAYKVRQGCPAAEAYLAYCIPLICDAIHTAGHSVPMLRDCLEARVLCGPKKKRRLDEDFCAALVMETQQRSGNASLWARMTHRLDL